MSYTNTKNPNDNKANNNNDNDNRDSSILYLSERTDLLVRAIRPNSHTPTSSHDIHFVS